MLAPTLDTAASYAPIAEALAVAFKSAGIPEAVLPVKNTFINFDEKSPLSPVGMLRSVSCPPFFPLSCSLADEACWEGATQVLCHAMAPRRTAPDEAISSLTSDFATPASSPRYFCSAASQETCTPRVSETGSLDDRSQSGQSGEWMHVPSRKAKKRQETRKHPQEVSRDGEKEMANFPAASGRARFFQKHSVGIEDDSAFRVVRRLLGPAGENLKHITEESGGAKIWICGQGSRRIESVRDQDGPLTVCISANSLSILHEASELVQDLLQTMHEEHTRFWSYQDSTHARIETRSADGPDICAFTCSFPVGIEEDASFQVVKRLVGKSGKHMKRIEAESDGASVRVCGRRSSKQDESQGPLVVHVSATSQRSLEKAATLVMALLTRVHADYHESCTVEGQPAPVLAVVCKVDHTSGAA